jgi:hypothetical protein
VPRLTSHALGVIVIVNVHGRGPVGELSMLAFPTGLGRGTQKLQKRN